MKIGGVQKSLCNLLWSVADQYDITLYLFAPIGAYMHDIPPQVHVLSCDSLFRYLGTSQKDCSTHWRFYRSYCAVRSNCRRIMTAQFPICTMELRTAFMAVLTSSY